MELSTSPEKLPPEWRELYEERAAIMEFDGRLSRERAEAAAWCEVVRRMKAQARRTAK